MTVSSDVTRVRDPSVAVVTAGSGGLEDEDGRFSSGFVLVSTVLGSSDAKRL